MRGCSTSPRIHPMYSSDWLVRGAKERNRRIRIHLLRSIYFLQNVLPITSLGSYCTHESWHAVNGQQRPTLATAWRRPPSPSHSLHTVGGLCLSSGQERPCRSMPLLPGVASASTGFVVLSVPFACTSLSSAATQGTCIANNSRPERTYSTSFSSAIFTKPSGFRNTHGYMVLFQPLSVWYQLTHPPCLNTVPCSAS